MKNLVAGWGVVAAAALVCTGSAFAQTVEFVSARKLEFNEQASAGLVAPIPAQDLPYVWEVLVEGESIDTIAPPVISGPIALGEPAHNGGVLGYDAVENAWRYGWPNFDDYAAETQGEIDSLFGSGTYTIVVDGVSVPLLLTGDVWPSTAPLLTLTGGNWNNGVYEIDPGAELTITTSGFAEYGANAEDGIWMWGSGPGLDIDTFNLASEQPGNTLAVTVPAGTLAAGSFYEIESGFFAASASSMAVAGLPDAWAVAGYERSTRLLIQTTGSSACSIADVTTTGAGIGAPGYGVPDGQVTGADLQFFVNAWILGCP